MTENYILIRVQEESGDGRGPTNMGRLRKEVHKAAEELGIDAADVVFRGDRTSTYYGSPKHEGFDVARSLFIRELDRARGQQRAQG